MPTHWTYTTFKPDDGLFQGDIIAREPLVGVLESVHKHFADPKYLAFIVLTQTCDLVVRGKTCKAKHISLGVIRPLSALVPEVLAEMCSTPRPGLFPQDRRKAVEDFLHRVLNQNEQAEGWVYLHPDGDVSIGEPSVAMLRISISLRADRHYDLIRSARIGRLDTEYRNKLGWLKGNLYSRIDTTDWGEKPAGNQEEAKIIRQVLETPIENRPPVWVPSGWIAAARTKVNLAQTPPDQLQQVLKQYAPPPPLDAALTEVGRVMNQLRNEFTEQPSAAFQAAIADDAAFLPIFARQIVDAIFTTIDPPQDERRWKLYEAVASDEILRTLVVARITAVAQAFPKRKGARQIPNLAEELSALSYLSPGAIGRIAYFAEEQYNAAYLAKAPEASAALADLKCSAPLVNHFLATAKAAILGAMAELVSLRLTNSTAFKKTLKPE